MQMLRFCSSCERKQGPCKPYLKFEKKVNKLPKEQKASNSTDILGNSPNLFDFILFIPEMWNGTST